MQNLGLDTSTDAARLALTRNDVAHQSVQALLDDLRHVVNEIPVPQRASAAVAVLEHHHPPVSEALLSEEGRRLQRLARQRLQSIVDNDAVEMIADAPSPATNRSSIVRNLALRVLVTAAIIVTCFAVGATLQRLL